MCGTKTFNIKTNHKDHSDEYSKTMEECWRANHYYCCSVRVHLQQKCVNLFNPNEIMYDIGNGVY